MARARVIKTIDELDAWVVHGEAAGSAVWTSTHVSSSGGGGYVGPYGGNVSAPTVSSRSTTHKRFFIRAAAGKETEIELSDSSFGVRDGHRVSAVYAKHKDDNSGWLVYLHNHDTGQSVPRDSSLALVRGRHQKRWFFLTLAASLWMFPFSLLLLGVWGYFYWQRRARFKELDAAILGEARRLAGERDAEPAGAVAAAPA